MVTINEEVIGYVGNKKEFEANLEKELNDNEEKNIAFAEYTVEPNYEYKLVSKNQEINNEEVMHSIEENCDITYFRYAINVENEEKQLVNTMDEAEQVVQNIKSELGENIEIGITKSYTKDLNISNSIEVATISTNIVAQVKEEQAEEKKKDEATFHGIYFAVNPVIGNITSRYGVNESIRDHTHKGLDIAAKTGTPIKAAADGTVTYSGTMSGYGNLIIIDHGNGVETYYGHCSKLYKKVGAQVKAGELIAAVGSTGNSTGPHLHLEIRLNGVYYNPAIYLYK